MTTNPIERVVLTPAERAVVVEQSEAMKVALDGFIEAAKSGTSYEAIHCYLDVTNRDSYINGLFQQKINEVAYMDQRKQMNGDDDEG